MSQALTRRTALAGAAALGATVVSGGLTAQEGRSKGVQSFESLGTMLKAMGLKPMARDKAHDFSFTDTDKSGEEWNLSMSVVLSTDEKSIWLMAWLDELPQSASDVPRTALLRLLSDNDMMGNGLFFAYVKANRRFVLQRVIKNEAVSSASLRSDLGELGAMVVNTYAHWAVKNWKQLSSSPDTVASPAAESAEVHQPKKTAVPKRVAAQDADEPPRMLKKK